MCNQSIISASLLYLLEDYDTGNSKSAFPFTDKFGMGKSSIT